MTTQRVSSVKIPMFDKNNYGLWKKKMTLFLQVENPKYLSVLKNGPKIPMIIEPESTLLLLQEPILKIQHSIHLMKRKMPHWI